MLSRAFLILELPRFDHPVLFEEKPYPGAPLPVAPVGRKAIVGANDVLKKKVSVVAAPQTTVTTKPGISAPKAAAKKRRTPREEDTIKAATRAATTAFAKPQNVKRTTSAPIHTTFPPEGNDDDDALGESDSPNGSTVILNTAEQQTLETAVISDDSDFFLVDDYEDGVASNPIEDKYRALARDTTRALVDKDLKPNVNEARALARIISSPSDDLAPLDRELVWKFRYTLTGDAQALPKFLLSVDWRVDAEVSQVRTLLSEWQSRGAIDIADALKLLGPLKAYQHDVVRSFAVDALRSATDEELIAYLLQLVQALRYSQEVTEGLPAFGDDKDEKKKDVASAIPKKVSSAKKKKMKSNSTDGAPSEIALEEEEEEDSPLLAFLSDRACASLAVANFVWWYLKVGAEDDTNDEAACFAYKVFRSRFLQKLAERAPETYATLKAQEQLVASVLSAQSRARSEKGRKDHKQEKLRSLLADLRFPSIVTENGVPMPLDPNIDIKGLYQPKTTPKMYRSAMYPALVAFEPSSGTSTKEDDDPSLWLGSLAASGSKLFPRRKFEAEVPPKPPQQEDEASLSDTTTTAPQRSFLDGVVGSFATAAFGTPAPPPTSDFEGDDTFDEAGTPAGKAPSSTGDPQQPLKPYRVIVKNGDDIRQDQLVLQFVLLMDLLLKRVNLDLKLTCFRTLATGPTSGFIEFVENSAPISAILADNQGSIINYLRHHNFDATTPDGVAPSARDNFTRSCAGYCVITYLLGVGDRHLDNIMVCTNGCLFHIDFGFILGKDPKPYPPPFRLTKEMAETMGYPDDPNYTQTFKSRCCQAYNILRKHASLLLNLMSLMKDAGIEHLSDASLQLFHDRFRLDLSDEDAERFFLSVINESLNALVPVVLERFHKIAVWMK